MLKAKDDYAAMQVAQIMSSKEECESGMVQQSSDAVAQDVKVNLRLEECAKNAWSKGQTMQHHRMHKSS